MLRRGLYRINPCFTAMHNFFLTRPDGTTAAERFFGQKPRSMIATILEAGELPRLCWLTLRWTLSQ